MVLLLITNDNILNLMTLGARLYSVPFLKLSKELPIKLISFFHITNIVNLLFRNKPHDAT